jgi:hypothetical protein
MTMRPDPTFIAIGFHSLAKDALDAHFRACLLHLPNAERGIAEAGWQMMNAEYARILFI